MKVIVTGATGFVASHLVPTLVCAGHDVIAVGHDRSRICHAGAALELDLAARAWPSLPEADAIVHLAQANVRFPDGADALFAVNTVATQRLLEHARRSGARHFVLASSGSVYGASDSPLSEHSPLAASDFYSATKLSAERVVQAYEGHLATTIMRLFVPYGPGQVRRMLPTLAARVRSREPIQLNEGGRPRFNPVYVDDVCRVVLRVLESEAGGGVLNVAGDEVTDVRIVSELIGEILDVVPVFEQGSAHVGDIVAETGRLHQLLGTTMPLVGLREGLERMVSSA